MGLLFGPSKTVLSRLTDTDNPTPETLAKIEDTTRSASLDYEGDLQLFSNDEAGN